LTITKGLSSESISLELVSFESELASAVLEASGVSPFDEKDFVNIQNRGNVTISAVIQKNGNIIENLVWKFTPDVPFTEISNKEAVTFRKKDLEAGL